MSNTNHFLIITINVYALLNNKSNMALGKAEVHADNYPIPSNLNPITRVGGIRMLIHF